MGEKKEMITTKKKKKKNFVWSYRNIKNCRKTKLKQNKKKKKNGLFFKFHFFVQNEKIHLNVEGDYQVILEGNS